MAQPGPQRGIMPRQMDSLPGPNMADAPGGDLPGADPLQILANSFQVQRDLGLNAHQLNNLQLASRNFMTQMQETMAPRPGRSPEQVRAVIDDQMAKTRPMISRELTSEQLDRLHQIMLQIQGPCAAIMDQSVAAPLRLTPPQFSQASAVCQDRIAQMRAAFQPPAPGEDPCRAAARNRDRLMAIRTDADARVLAAFSPEQQHIFADMEGRPLPLEPPLPPGCPPPNGG